MTSRGRWVTICALLCFCTACAGNGDAVTTATTRFLDAVDQGDGEAACTMLSPPAEESLTSDGTDCATALTELDLPSGGGVRTTSVWSDRAQVHTADDVLFLVDLSNGWRIAAAGCEQQPDEIYKCVLEAS
ncbi:hypothetical protein [Actinophytocola sp.]|uniref:hypothetical protein n=1 Tax=Actinophytocola sp. TaxID=1872138 RepID=UPI002ECFEF42